jgi:hypothetical protein
MEQCGLVARSLNEARRQVAQHLDRQVVRVTAEPVQADRRRLFDKREIRGWPAAGRGVNGAIHGSEPGYGLFDE